VTQAEQPPASSGPAPDPAGSPGVDRQGAKPTAPPKDWPLWLWPPLAVALIALAGYRFGIAGALTTAASAVATLIFVAGDFLYAGHRRRAFAIISVSVGVIVLTVLLSQAKVPWIRPLKTVQTISPGPIDLRGATITQAQATTLNLRGAQLSGAVLDGLVLRGKQMEGVTASGASFRDADLSFASFRGADLNGADFSYACLIGTDFTGALLDGANVSHAVFNLHTLPKSVQAKLIGIPISPPAHSSKCLSR
jgi:hypothetical protein